MHVGHWKHSEKYIIKDIINLQSKKKLQLFLSGTDELLERIFDSSKDIPMMVLNAAMKIEKINMAFLQLFELEEMPASGSRLVDLHSFWSDEENQKQDSADFDNQLASSRQNIYFTSKGRKIENDSNRFTDHRKSREQRPAGVLDLRGNNCLELKKMKKRK